MHSEKDIDLGRGITCRQTGELCEREACSTELEKLEEYAEYAGKVTGSVVFCASSLDDDPIVQAEETDQDTIAAGRHAYRVGLTTRSAQISARWATEA